MAWLSWKLSTAQDTMDVFTVVAKPLVAEALRSGKGFILKIADKREVMTYFGTRVGMTFGQEDDRQYFAIVIPVYLVNCSKYEVCLVKEMRCEAARKTGLARAAANSIVLVGTHLVNSLDFLEEEARLAANWLREQSPAAQAQLARLRWESRRLFEGIIVEPQQIRRETIEFRCPLGGKEGRANFSVSWRITIRGECVFPSVGTGSSAVLGYAMLSTTIPFGTNMVHVCQLEGEEGGDWRQAQPVSDWLD